MALAEAVHELASVTTTSYVPAVRPVIVAVPSPVGVPDQLYVYEVIPPITLAVRLPLVPPLQLTLVDVGIVTTNCTGEVIVNVWVAVQALASVTVQVQVPAVNPVTLTVPSPVGLPGSSYRYSLLLHRLLYLH